MRKVLVFLLMLVLPSAALAEPPDNLNIAEIEDRISSIVHYAEEYEIGNINYFQLNVYGFQIRSDLNLLLGGGIGENWARIPKENIEKIFGTPYDYTYWVWVDNMHMNKRLNESLPWWERIVFDGRKVRIVFNAFPSAIEGENGEMFKYYSVDLGVQFKKTYDIDASSIFGDMTSLAAEHNRTQTRKSGEAFVQKMLDYEMLLGGYFGENIEQCTEIMSGFFTPDERAPKQKTMTWWVTLYSGSDFDVLANVDMCEECVWHHVSVYVTVEGRGPMNVFKAPELRYGKLEQKVDEEYYWTLTVDEVNKELKKTILEIIDDAEKFDKTRSEDFPKKFYFNRYKAMQISRLMDGKYNDVEGLDESIGRRIESGELQGPGECKDLEGCRMYCGVRENIGECRNFTYSLRVGALENIFSGYRIERTPADQLWWERQLFENSAISQQNWCRHTNDVQCNEDDVCADGKCVTALVGNEICNNGVDDDRDNATDCGDTDCVQEKICETEYECNGVKQKRPCATYVCDGRGYTKPCDEINITCGKNQILAGNECACREGFRDCDGNGNCEPTKFCGLEICDDSKDNNGDGMVDCSDQTCNRQVCGIEDGKDLLCIGRMCIPPEKEIPEKGPEPVCGNHVCEENEIESCSEDCTVCEVYEPPECADGKIVWKGKDNLGCPLPPICVVTKKACESNDDCAQPKCGVSECVYGECKVTELLTVCEEGCKEGKTRTRACKDGSEITTAICSANEWVKTEYDCPEVSAAPVAPPAMPEAPTGVQPEVPEEVPPVAENVTEEITPEIPPAEEAVPEKNVSEVKENITEVPIILPVILPEENITEEEIPGAAEEIAPEVEKKAPEASNECVVMNDCGGAQDVCSNGNCAALPIHVEEKIKEKEKKTPESEAPGKPETIPEAPTEAASSGRQPEETETSQPELPQEFTPVPEQSQESRPETPTGNVVAGFANVVTGLITGLAEGKSQCNDECRPCDECNQAVDTLMKRIEAGEFSGPNNCKNRVGCDNYCQMDNHKEECENFFRGYGLETFYCWQQGFCRECDKCKFTAGELTCNANQQFNMDNGFCECSEGWFECDGDWETGCESPKRCDACQVDNDCAKDRCAPWGNVVQQFACFRGEERMEIRGAVRAIGTCRFYPTKRMEGGVGFDMWGEPFEMLYPIKEQTQREMGTEWCGRELENNIRERVEIQNSLTNDFLKWFFEEYVPSSPSEWEQHIGGIYDSYWRIVNNDQAVVENLLCTGNDKLPEEYKPMDVTYDTEFGSVRIWEDETTTDFFGKRTKIFSPYMQIWVFPPKEFIKKEFQEAMETGMMPGPEGKKGPELSPSEIEEMRKDKKLMDTINSISGKYGGEAKFLLNIVDGNELVFNALITINPEILIKIEPMKTYESDYDAKIIFDFDFFYSLISTSEKEIRGGETLYPPWEREGLKIGDMIKGFVDGVKMWFMINSAAASGDVRAEPGDALSDGLTIMHLLFERGPQ